MGNHCIDCKFCGKDQRIVGDHCCPEYVAEQEKLVADAKAKYEAERDYLARYGLEVHDTHGYWNGKVDASDVVAMLKKREGKILKPGRRPKKEPTVYFDD